MKYILFLFALFSSCYVYSINPNTIENGEISTFIPIVNSEITSFIPVVVEANLPQKIDDDGTLLGVDIDNDGVRDDVERKIAYLFPSNKHIRGYLYHLAAYTRRVLASEVSPKIEVDGGATIIEGAMISRELLAASVEQSKVLICLNNDIKLFNYIVSLHLDSKERFSKYFKVKGKMLSLLEPNFNFNSCLLENNEERKEIPRGFISSARNLFYGYVSDDASVNRNKKLGFGINIPAKLIISNKVGSASNLEIKLYQGNSHVGTKIVNVGETQSFTFLHDFDFENVDNYMRWEINKLSSGTGFFEIEVKPDIDSL